MLLITFLITVLYPLQILAEYGEFAEVGNYKFEVGITHRGKFVCGGVLVDLKLVVTAAHCIKYDELKDLRVVAGEVKVELFRDEHKNEVKAIKLHPRYRETSKEFDIAVLILKKDIESSHSVAPIHIINSDYTITAATTVKLVAWDHLHNIRLASANTALWDPNKCTALNIYGPYDFNYPSTPLTSENTFCIDIPTDSCIYDDAGAVLVNEQLLGIVSWNINCNQTDKPLVCTNMAIFGEWVERVTKEG